MLLLLDWLDGAEQVIALAESNTSRQYTYTASNVLTKQSQ